jgi:hypothetical protein
MLEVIHEISKKIEDCINEFWRDITTVNPEKLIIESDNLLMLFLYIILQARIPTLFAYVKLIEEFSTPYVSCQSKFGYHLSTLKIALDKVK